MHRPVTLLVAAVLVALSGCGVKSGEDGGVNPDVPATASPEEVVAGYMQALQDHDDEGAVALTIHAYGWGDAWSTDPPRIEDVEVGVARPDVLEGSTQNQWDDAVVVPVTLSVYGDEVMPDGPPTLEVILWRGRVNDRWLIAGIY